jgi:UDP-N-acetylglucosamine transferase subunit ALG13
MAVSVLPQAARRGIQSHYIESATRVKGPSLAGRILQRAPGVNLYSQYSSWARPPWNYRGSIFDGFRTVAGPPRPPARILVTLGMSESYGFRALLERVLAVAPPGAEVTWQTGSTDVEGLPIDARRSMPSAELDAALERADVVVSHAGTGSSIAALRAGKVPVLVPRRAARGEHVDDHQEEIALELAGRGLALHREVDQLDLQDLIDAAALCVVRQTSPPAFELVG